jgi:hypothetical protein
MDSAFAVNGGRIATKVAISSSDVIFALIETK